VSGDADRFEMPTRAERDRSELLALGCPPRAVAMVLEGGLVETDATRFLDKPADDKPLTLLCGPPGTGKTVAGVRWLAGLHEAMARGEYAKQQVSDPLFITAFALARWPRYDDETMRWLRVSRAIALDDLGREYLDAKGHFASVLEELVDLRYSHERPLLVTSNLTSSGVWERVGMRIHDRWRECGRVLEIRAPSLRRAGGAGGAP